MRVESHFAVRQQAFVGLHDSYAGVQGSHARQAFRLFVQQEVVDGRQSQLDGHRYVFADHPDHSAPQLRKIDAAQNRFDHR